MGAVAALVTLPKQRARTALGASDAHGSRPVLVVESDAQAAGALIEQLLADGCLVELAQTAEHARMLARQRPPRLAVLGRVDPPRGGLELLEEIRAGVAGPARWAAELPVIVLGAAASELDMLRAFDAGADDFLARPVSYLELRARMLALQRRLAWKRAPAHTISVGALAIDLDGRSASVDGVPLDLRPLEFELLAHLASAPERVFAKQELLHAVWGYRASGSTRTVDSHASRLRRKLDTRGGRWVINVHSVGYRLR